jgi:hypothetical protein
MGRTGKNERIQDWVCQACGSKFTVRRHRVLYRLETRSGRVAEALTFLAEGMDASVLERVWGIGEGILGSWLTRAGLHAANLHEHFFQGLSFSHIQLDELWANVRQESQEVWVWAVMEVTTKLVPVIHFGPRTLERAYAVVHELQHRLQPACSLPVFSSDGLQLYLYALTAHFGQWFVPEGGRKWVWQPALRHIAGRYSSSSATPQSDGLRENTARLEPNAAIPQPGFLAAFRNRHFLLPLQLCVCQDRLFRITNYRYCQYPFMLTTQPGTRTRHSIGPSASARR